MCTCVCVCACLTSVFVCTCAYMFLCICRWIVNKKANMNVPIRTILIIAAEMISKTHVPLLDWLSLPFCQKSSQHGRGTLPCPPS